MKHIVIGAHGNLAEAFLETVRMIAGTEQTSCIHAIGMRRIWIRRHLSKRQRS